MDGMRKKDQIMVKKILFNGLKYANFLSHYLEKFILKYFIKINELSNSGII